jgi:hypothetical protein
MNNTFIMMIIRSAHMYGVPAYLLD